MVCNAVENLCLGIKGLAPRSVSHRLTNSGHASFYLCSSLIQVGRMKKMGAGVSE